MNTNLALAPWLSRSLQKLLAAPERLPQALLLTANVGVGKRHFAYHLAQALLCENNNGIACGQCTRCEQVQRGVHADLHCLISELEWSEHRLFGLEGYADRYHHVEEREKRTKPRRVITVDQVRGLIDGVSSHSHSGGLRVVLICPADAMNRNAANALLKTLEEPPDDCRFILVVDNSSAILPTIRSRCMLVNLATATYDERLQWLSSALPEKQEHATALKLCGGAVYSAYQMLNNDTLAEQQQWALVIDDWLQGKYSALQLAAQFEKMPYQRVLTNLLHLVYQYIHQRHGLPTAELAAIPLELPAQSAPLTRWYELYDKLLEYKSKDPATINPRLAWEVICLQLAGLLGRQ